VLDEAIENKVRVYVEYYRLDAQGADRVRRRLQKHDRGVTTLYQQFRAEKAPAFQELIQATQADIDAILREELERRGAGK
jgi:uridine kinase